MDAKEILKFCLERGFLVDQEVLNMLSGESDIDSVKLMIERIKLHTQKKIITKDLFVQNQDKAGEFFLTLPEENQQKLEKLKIKLGLSIEISKEVSVSAEKTISEDDDSKGEVKILSLSGALGKKFGAGDFVNYFRGRFSEMKGFLQDHPLLENLVSIDKISGVRHGISVIGMVYDKRATKNQNIILDIEDSTGTTKVLINKDKAELLKKAEEIALDSVIGFKCSGSREMLFVNDIIFPEAMLLEKRKSLIEEYALFVSDVHYGGKNFMKNNFMRFIEYLNSDDPEVAKIKYIFFIGDLVAGVGVYPNQERDLTVVDLEDQYTGIAELLGKIPKRITLIVSTGDHEGVRIMEPQPLYDEKHAWALHQMDNVILTENPALTSIGVRKDFSGIKVLSYHGHSYPFYANSVPRLMKMKAMNYPEKIMEYLLKHRHLAPTHGSTQYFPNKDAHMIREIPDIFVSGHTHKSGVTYFNNVLIISCSCWETLTSYQEKMGNLPDHCKVPLVNLKTRAVKILDFE
ncbi:MAG: metallophosphoesterase [Nanoarchaeota archaeon]